MMHAHAQHSRIHVTHRHERVLGGEWWVQRRDEREDIGFHHDKDEALASNQATMKFPEVHDARYFIVTFDWGVSYSFICHFFVHLLCRDECF
jgi:hypothetical protein